MLINRPSGISICLIFVLLPTLVACQAQLSPQDQQSSQEIKTQTEPLEAIHEKMKKPQPGDWLTRHDEPGQTFSQYVRARPVRPDKKRKFLYVQPIGEFSEKQQEIFQLTTEFLELYFGTPVKRLDLVDLDSIPDKAKRVHPSWGDHQLLTTHLLQNVLQRNLPEDGWALLGLTSSDLWPGDGWNFVFGQASLRNRVGVWSIYRNGDPAENDAAFKLCLLRTLKTATHETGHMLSMQHCIFFECNMCGSNNRSESDRRPVYLCPVCTAKITWATNSNPLERAKKLAKFCDENRLDSSAKYYAKSIEILSRD